LVATKNVRAVPGRNGNVVTVVNRGRERRFGVGEAKQKLSATRKFIAEFPNCAFCGGSRPAITREHMPPKALFDDSHRPDKLVMPACDECNRGTSTTDLVAAIVSRWNYNSGQTELEDHHKLIGQVRMHHPEIYAEWTSQLDFLSRLKKLQHLEKQGVQVPKDAGLVTIGPETIRQLNLFSHKVVLALYFDKFQKPLSDSGRISAYWRTKEDFAKEGVPRELLEMMQHYGTLEQGKWSVQEAFEYRFNFNEAEGLYMCLARFRGGLFTTGFAISDEAILEDEKNAAMFADDKLDWIKPSELLSIPNFCL
jgi:hypothetical protein